MRNRIKKCDALEAILFSVILFPLGEWKVLSEDERTKIDVYLEYGKSVPLINKSIKIPASMMHN